MLNIFIEQNKKKEEEDWDENIFVTNKYFFGVGI